MGENENQPNGKNDIIFRNKVIEFQASTLRAFLSVIFLFIKWINVVLLVESEHFGRRAENEELNVLNEMWRTATQVTSSQRISRSIVSERSLHVEKAMTKMLTEY